MMSRFFERRSVVVALAALFVAALLASSQHASAQPIPQGTGSSGTGLSGTGPNARPTGTIDIDALAQQALNSPSVPTQAPPLPAAKKDPAINLFELAWAGGPLMWPIYLGSILVVCFSIERAMALRKRKLIPPELVRELGELSKHKGGVDPRAAYRACLKYPSTASTVIRAVLLKIGRPFAELEATLKEVNEREAAKLYRNVRPIELQISVAPLLGLLGTVQGMILAFMKTAGGSSGPNKAADLAGGIYVALVTTFAGLCVAIPAAVLAHYFEGKIQALFRDIDEFVLGMLPQWERFEGKLRVSRQSLGGEAEHAADEERAAAVERASLAERAPASVPK
jgi:biopolymer transport protein ExbB